MSNVSGDSVSASQSASKRARKNESKVWRDFDVIPPGSCPKYNDNRKRGKCKHCGIVVLADGHNGTNSMNRHIPRCPLKVEPINHDVRQMIIESSVTGGNIQVRSTKFEQEKHRENMALAIIVHEYPFQFVEHEFNRNCHSYLNPEVKHISRNTIKAYVLKLYRREKKKLFNFLQAIPGRVCLTADMWSAITSDGYITLTAHLIDKEWRLHKRILNFCCMPPPHTGIAIAEKIFVLLATWNLDKRVFSITLDNASSNDTFVAVFKNQLRLKEALMLGGEFFHVRCCAHILNIMVQDGLKEIDSGIFKIRESVKFVKGSQSRKKKFIDYATQLSISSKRGLCQDVSTRWNSTFLMVESALHYRNVFCHLALSDSNYIFCPTIDEWDQIDHVCKFLKLYYDLTNLFSGTKYPTINLFFHGMWRIQSQLNEEMMSPNLFIRSMASRMQVKFDKYWRDCNVILAIGVVLDPRYKMKVVEFAFSKIYGDEGKSKVAMVRDKLYRLFEEYYDHCDEDHASSSKQSTQQVEVNDGDDPYAMAYDSFQSDDPASHEQKSELDLYLHEPSCDRRKELDILEFWNSVQFRYPKLSQMARDVLSIPLTTVASESAFSSGGRTLDKYRNCLLPENVEALICCRDWLHATINKIKPDTNKSGMDDVMDGLLKIDLNVSISDQASNDVEVEDIDDDDDDESGA